METCKRCGRTGSHNEMFVHPSLKKWLCLFCYNDYMSDLEEFNYMFCNLNRFCEKCEKEKKEHEIAGLICKDCMGFVE